MLGQGLPLQCRGSDVTRRKAITAPVLIDY